MNHSEKIRKYLDNELTSAELKKFKDEINNSPLLQNEINRYRETLNEFASLKNIKTDEKYFVNLLPRFHETSGRSRVPWLKVVYSAGSLAVVLFLSVIFLIMKNNNDQEVVYQNLNQDEINFYLDEYRYDFNTISLLEDIPEDYDSLVNVLMETELKLNEVSEDYFVDVSNDEFVTLINNLSSEEVDGIYNTLIK